MISILLVLATLLISNSWTLTILILPFLIVIIATNIFSPIGVTTFFTPYLSLDLIRVSLIILSIWTTALILIRRFKILSSKSNHNLFLRVVITLLIILTIAFSVNDLLLFYVFFEASLVPTVILILIWGYQPERLQASIYLIIYTVIASLPLLIILLTIISNQGSLFWLITPIKTKIPVIKALALTLAFFVKIPIYPFHLWLPKAHVEAPVAGSIILARILLKLGAYGLLRTLTLIPQLISFWGPYIIAIALIGSLLTSIACVRILDIKILIAYASVRHIGIIVAATLSSSKWGWTRTLIIIIAHGLARSGLFSLSNTYYETFNTRSIILSKGMLILSPPMALIWFLIIIANIRTPPTLNFIAEVIILTSIVHYSSANIIFGLLVTLFRVVYSILLYTSLAHGGVIQNIQKTFLKKSSYLLVRALHIIPLYLLPLSSTSFMWL